MSSVLTNAANILKTDKIFDRIWISFVKCRNFIDFFPRLKNKMVFKKIYKEASDICKNSQFLIKIYAYFITHVHYFTSYYFKIHIYI